jgi:hypothetical protein
MKLSEEQAQKIVEIYFSCGKSATAAARRFNLEANNNNNHQAANVTRKNVLDVIGRFKKHSSIQRPLRHRTSCGDDENTLLRVLSAIHNRPNSSIRTCAAETGLSIGTSHHIARNVLKLYPYRLLLVQQLSDYDKLVRVEACKRLLEVVTDDKFIIFTDEATYRLDGHVNRWNCRLWDFDRPDNFLTGASQHATHVNVWAGISKTHLFGPYFFPSTITGDIYRAMISEIFIPDLLNQIGSTDHVWFHQDGASVHTAKETKTLLESYFDDRIISLGFPHEWPPRSPDLTPCDFYLWGTVQDIVFRNGARPNVQDLQNSLIQAFGVLRAHHVGDIFRAVQSVPQRMEQCVLINGCQLIHR